MSTYPYEDGDVIVLGPEVFVAKDGTVLCWRGENYVPQEEPRRRGEALTSEEAYCLLVALAFGDPSHVGQADPRLESAKAKLKALAKKPLAGGSVEGTEERA